MPFFKGLLIKVDRSGPALLPLKLGITRGAVDLIHFMTGQDTEIAAEHVSGCCGGKMCTGNIQK